jgi:hypothetical protein
MREIRVGWERALGGHGALPSRPLSLEELPLTLPPMFAEACGYQGKARYVAICWTPQRGELWWSDDGHATLGEADAFLTLCRHRASGDLLRRYESAAADDGSRPWLLLDRDRRTVSIGTAAEVSRLVAGQADGAPPPRRGPSDPRWQRNLERSVSAWLDWMATRKSRGLG